MKKRNVYGTLVALIIAGVAYLIMSGLYTEKEDLEEEQLAASFAQETIADKPDNIGDEGSISSPSQPVPRSASNPRVFQFANTNFPMAFVDGDWSDELKDLVQEDMTLIFAHLSNYEVIQNPFPPEAYQVNGEHIVSSCYIRFKGRGRIWPDAYDGQVGHLIEKNGEFSLVVSEDLLVAYEKALVFKNENKGVFDALDSFVSMLNDTDEMDEISKSTKLSRNMFYFYNETPWEEYAPSYQNNIEVMHTIKTRRPSILSFENEEYNEATIIIASPLMWSKENPLVVTDFPPFCYANNKWYICIPPLP